jgi:hypothetical protein
MQDDDLLAQHPPDNEQWFDHAGQVGDIRDQLLDPALELHRPDYADLEAEVTQSPAQIVLDRDRLRLQQFAMGQQHPQLLAAQRLHMHRTIKSRPHHLCDAAGIVAVGLVDLRLQNSPPIADSCSAVKMIAILSPYRRVEAASVA